MTRQFTKLTNVCNVYDFDKTIYNGDCSLDFYLFSVRKSPVILRYLPYQLWHLVLFVLRYENRTTFKGHFFVFLRGLGDVTKLVDQFWCGHYRSIKAWYRDTDHSKDVIISASPEFLLRPVSSLLKVHTLIATRMDAKTGLIEGKNCRGNEKVSRLLKEFHNPKVIEAYSDSLSDLPILRLAAHAYIIKRHKIVPLEEYRELSFVRRISW